MSNPHAVTHCSHRIPCSRFPDCCTPSPASITYIFYRSCTLSVGYFWGARGLSHYLPISCNTCTPSGSFPFFLSSLFLFCCWTCCGGCFSFCPGVRGDGMWTGMAMVNVAWDISWSCGAVLSLFSPRSCWNWQRAHFQSLIQSSMDCSL